MSRISIDKPEVDIIDNINTDSRGSIVELSHFNTLAKEESNKYDWSDIDEKNVVKKIDYHLIPLFSILYLMCYLDRGNIGNAKIEGLQEDLGLTDDQYNLCLTVFFLTYSFFEAPSNMLLKKIGKQSIYIPTLALIWGGVMISMGTVNNYHQLLVTRLFLGVFESGLFPGLALCLTQYYCKNEMQFRQALFYAAASIAGAFSGLLAFAIAKMDGIGGYAGWRWIFILEGLLTVFVALSSFIFMPDYPDTAKFLTQRERDFVLWRLANDNNMKRGEQLDLERHDNLKRSKPNFNKFTDHDDINLKQALFEVFKDFQMYIHILIYWSIATPTYSTALFLPSVIKALGYTSSMAQLLTIPLYIAASIISVIQALFSDKIGIRSIFVGGNLFLVIIGFAMALAGQETNTPGVMYAACFIAVIGLYAGFPGIISWLSNNLANSRKRAIGMGLHIGIGNLGGCFASNFYKPGKYTMGHGLAFGFSTMGFICTIFLTLIYKKINHSREDNLSKGKYDEVSDEELFKMGDKSPYFRYRV